MLKKTLMIFTITIFLSTFFKSFAQNSPYGRKFGFGIVLGEPTGLTAKVWTHNSNAFVFDLGNSYFGDLRVNIDYLWHFDAFNSKIAYLYAGPGGVVGFGSGNDFWYKGKYHRINNEAGFGVRGVFGLNVVPERTPLELFFEIGVLVGLAPDFGSSVDGALGVRFYP